MPTIRDNILTALVTALNTGAPVGVPVASRVRTRAIEQAVLPIMSVYPIREDVVKPGSRHGAIVVRRLEVSVECWATGEPLDQATDAMVAWVTKALVNSNLGGLALTVDELATTWQYTQGAEPAVLATVTLQVEYRTAVTDQTLDG